MKLILLYIVLLIYSLCASVDLKIYPGLKLDFSEKQRRNLESFINNDDVYQKWNLHLLMQNYDNINEIHDIVGPKRLRKFIFKQQDNFPFRPQDSDPYKTFKSLQNHVHQYTKTHLSNRHLYEQKNEYTSKVTDGNNDINAAIPENVENNLMLIHEQEYRKDALRNAKFVEDPNQFAYAPTDARFFRKSIVTGKEEDATRKSRIPIFDNNKNMALRDHNIFYKDMFQDSIPESKQNDKPMTVLALGPTIEHTESIGVYIVAIIAGISAAATVCLIAVGIGWYNLQKTAKNASNVDYPAYGVTGPNKDTSPSSDKRLAQSAQMYHYQHQKQQIIAMESKVTADERHGSVSDNDSDEENEEGDYTVYECPGLAPAGEMEVKNPLFHDDPTPAQTPSIKTTVDDNI